MAGYTESRCSLAFSQVTIIGVGLLGGSLGLALRRRRMADCVVGVGHRESTLREAEGRGAVDRWTLDPAEGVAGADLVVLCTPVGLFESLVAAAAPELAPGCILTDVGSTKQAVVDALLPLLPEGVQFVSSHPLAGSEMRGIDAASVALYDGSLVVVVPTDRSEEPAVARIESLWRDLGARTRRMAADVHDRLLAHSSHLPHLAASLLVEALGAEAEPLVAGGWLDTTRVASGDPAMWRDIVMTNREAILQALDCFADLQASLRQAIDSGDAAAVETLLRHAKGRRDRLLGDR